ncbi:hypothetical protein AAE478_009510 [Parahypoxylon ruwenzoriense]
MESKTNRYQSRILREMHQNTENPFNSPPSSTGSHGTITLTSNLTMGPQGESTRRMDDDSIKLPSQAAMRGAKAPQPPSFTVNTSALGRTFPEWSRWNPNGREEEEEKDMWEIASDCAPIPEGKENVTPHGSPNSSMVATPRAEDSDRDKVSQNFLDHLRYLRHKLREPTVQRETTIQQTLVVTQMIHELAADARARRESRAARKALRESSPSRGGDSTTRKYIQPRRREAIVAEKPINPPIRRSINQTAKPSNASKDHASKASRGPLRSRAQMQPRVQTESECSLDLSEPLARPRQDQPDQAAHPSHPRTSTPNPTKGSKPRRGNVTALLETLKTAQTKQAESKESSAKNISPKSQSPVQTRKAIKPHVDRQSALGIIDSPTNPNFTARSFFLPNLSHMNDFLSGALRLSSFKNGIPVFVKHGKVHDRESTISPDHHADVEAIAIPEDEEKIFVSLDKIKDEIQALKEHDELISKQADQLEEEVEELHIQIAKYKSRKDSAVGSDSEGSMIDHLNTQKAQLEEQISSLQARLDKANRKISINEIHTESYVAERDEALKNASEHLNKIKQLQSELNLAREELETLRDGNTQDANALESENKSLRKDNNSIRQQWKSLLEENQSLRSHNSAMTQHNADLEHDLKAAKVQVDSNKAEFDSLQQECELALEEKALLKQDNLSLEHQNDKILNDNKVLQQQNSLLDRRNQSLREDIDRLEKLLDAADGETGMMSADVKDIKYRLEVQNRELAKENAELQQQIIDLQADFSCKRMNYEQDKRRLTAANDRLKNHMDQISKRFEQIVKESQEEVARYEEQHVTLTQQLELIAGKESALAEKLRKSATQEAVLQSKLDRKTDAVNEARQLTQEIKNFMSILHKKKTAKAPRVVESKGKSTVSEATARSTISQTDLALQDDYTQQINLSQGSDFVNLFAPDEIPRLRDALRQIRNDTQQKDLTGDSFDFDDDDMSEQASQSLPPFPANGQPRAVSSHRTVSGASKGRVDATKSQPVGILKDTQLSRLNLQKQKTARTIANTEFEEPRELDRIADSNTGARKSKPDEPSPRKVSFSQRNIQSGRAKTRLGRATSDPRLELEQDLSGRFSVKSGLSEASQTEAHLRRSSDSAQFDVDTNHEENMTSALFMDDITLEQQKTAARQSAKRANPELSKDAKRVLDNLCHDHDCRNCMVCARINSHRREDGVALGGVSKKKTVHIERPVPVSDRIPDQTEYEDQSTMRPSQEPAVALAKVIKALQDEERHIKNALAKKSAVYNECDPAIHRRMWKQLGSEMEKLRKAQDLKRDQIYYLHDVLEGQKVNGQEMTASYVEETIVSILSKDPSWNGVPGY